MAKTGSLVEVASRLIHRIGYQNELARLYKEAADQQSRWTAVEEVINSLAAYEKRAARPTLAGFLEEVVLGDRDDEPDKDSQLARNAIALMTLHSAKGLEFPHVYLVGMEEGLLPHHRSVSAEGMAIDEERRLCYVGITRAQDRLTLSLALTRMKWGKPRPTLPSRFLFEVTGEADKARAAANGRPPGQPAGAATGGKKGPAPARRQKTARRIRDRRRERQGAANAVFLPYRPTLSGLKRDSCWRQFVLPDRHRRRLLANPDSLDSLA